MRIVPCLLVLSACSSSKDPDDSPLPGDSEAPGETAPPVDTADSEDTDDSGEALVVEVSDLAWRLHDEIESLVYVSWQQSAAATVHVEYAFEGSDWMSSPSLAAEAGVQEQPLLGIPYDEVAGWHVVVEGGESFEGEHISTGPLPAGLPLPLLLASDPELWEPSGQYLLGSINADSGGWVGGEYWMFIVNRMGQVVWAMRGEDDDFTIYVQASKDGDILWDVATYWSDWDGGAGSRIHRMKIDGTILDTHAAAGMHHVFIELPDGSLVWGASTSNSENLMRRDLKGDEEMLWSCAPFYKERGLSDWCHTNSIFLSEATNSFLLSFPTRQTFVLEIDASTGEELRWFGHIDDSWAFDPPNSAFQYQHGVSFTDAGTLLVSSQASSASNEGVVREYSLDEKNETLEEIWNYGLGDGIDADFAGEARRLANGNTLHNTGTTPRVREITPDGEVVWDLAWSGYRLLGHTTFQEDLYVLAP